MRQTPGEFLRLAREGKKISIKQAAEETHITSRHITAIEADNFGVFPGETYTMGFLRSYATYLDVDPEKVLQLYKGSQISEKESPIEELTRPTVQTSDYIQKYSRVLVFVALLIGIILVSILFVNRAPERNAVVNGPSAENSDNAAAANIEDFLKNSTTIPEVETEHVKIKDGYTTSVIPVSSGIDFSVDNTEVYLVLMSLGYQKGAQGQSIGSIELYPGKRTWHISENEPIEINEPGISKPLRVTLIGATPNNAKVQIEVIQNDEGNLENANNEDLADTGNEVRIANPSNFILKLEGSTNAPNYVEFFVDGKQAKRGQLAAGSQFYYEANDSIQMKIGDAGAVTLRINGKPQVLGKKGQTVNKIIRKERDPVEQTKFRVVVKDG